MCKVSYKSILKLVSCSLRKIEENRGRCHGQPHPKNLVLRVSYCLFGPFCLCEYQEEKHGAVYGCIVLYTARNPGR